MSSLIKQIIFWFIFLCLAWIAHTTFLTEFTTEQQLTIGLLGIAVYLWTASPIPSGAVSIVLIASMLLLGVANTVEDALAGFLSPALYFILVLSLISQSLTKVGIDKAIARVVIKLSKGGARFIVVGIPIFILFLPIVLPSAIARYKILLPLINRLNDYYGYGEKSLFKKYCMYVLGMLNQNATMVVFTGGGFSVLASQLIQDYHVAELSWFDWFLRMAPPLWIAMCLFAWFVWYFLKFTTPKEQWLKGNITLSDMEEETSPIPLKFWIVLAGFVLMVLAWIVTDHQQVPLILPPMLLVIFYSLPKINLIDNHLIRNYDWENFLLLGASFSIGILMEKNGTAMTFANQLVNHIPTDASMVFNVVIIALFVFVLRFLFAIPSTAMVVIFPIVISYGELLGISEVALAFLVVMVIGGMMVLPMHSPTIYYVYESGIFNKREQYTIGILSSIVMVIFAILSAIYYW